MAKNHLPGAPRKYRSGIHQGFDFFDGLSGRPLAPDEPVVAIAAGEVVRIDHTYADSDSDELLFWADQGGEPGFLGDFALDKLRGRQVWLRHADGHISRYAHLSVVHPELHVGYEVEQGQAIGLMGNSGVPPTDDQPDPAPHLHFELWSPDGSEYMGDGLSPLQSHRLVASLFGNEALPRYAQGVVRRIDTGQSPPEDYPPDELPVTEFSVEPPGRVTEGQAFAIPVLWQGDDFRPDDIFAFLEDIQLGVIDSGDGAWIVGAMPAVDTDSLSITIGATDSFGQTLHGSQQIQLDLASRPILPLELSTEHFEAHDQENFRYENNLLMPTILQSMEFREPLWQQPFDAPLNGDIIRPFGQRVFHGILRSDHPLPGVGVAAPAGEPVLAVNSGVVGFVEDLPIRGHTVAVIHGGGIVSIYAHLANSSVAIGEEVAINQQIGTVGSTGAISGPQLRWEMLVAGIPSDPLQWPDKILPGRPGS